MKLKTSQLKRLLPIVVLALGIAAAYGLMQVQTPSLPPAEMTEIPEVEVLVAQAEALKMNVQTQGLVNARDEIELVTEVSGKVSRISPNLLEGGFFVANEVLLTIDSRDYDFAIMGARAQLASAKRQLLSEQAQVEQARNEWQALGEGEATDLALHRPQLAEAQAKLAAAEADLAKAKLNRSRCEVRAPFAGRVRSKKVGLGQYIQAGMTFAQILSSDVAEVRLPVSTEQLAFLTLPLQPSAFAGPTVELSAQIGSQQFHWEGRIVRTAAGLDIDNAQLYLIAEVSEPYRKRQQNFPLLNGLLVQADIVGKIQSGVFVLPRTSVNALQEVWLVNAKQRLESRKVEIVRYQNEQVLIKSGLSAGDQVVISDMQVPVAGTLVRIHATP